MSITNLKQKMIHIYISKFAELVLSVGIEVVNHDSVTADIAIATKKESINMNK